MTVRNSTTLLSVALFVLTVSGCANTMRERAYSEFAQGKSGIHKIAILSPLGHVTRLHGEGKTEILTDFSKKMVSGIYTNVERILGEKNYDFVRVRQTASFDMECKLLYEINIRFSGIVPFAYGSSDIKIEEAYSIDYDIPVSDVELPGIEDADALLYINYLGFSKSNSLHFSQSLGAAFLSLAFVGAASASGGYYYVPYMTSGKKNVVHGTALLIDARTGKLLWSRIFSDSPATGAVRRYARIVAESIETLPARDKAINTNQDESY